MVVRTHTHTARAIIACCLDVLTQNEGKKLGFVQIDEEFSVSGFAPRRVTLSLYALRAKISKKHLGFQNSQ